MRIAVKSVGDTVELVETVSKYRMDAVAEQLKKVHQRAVWLDAKKTLAIVFDDLGQMKQAPLNFFIEVPSSFSPVQAITGKVVFVRTKPANPFIDIIWDYEVEDLSSSDIAEIRHLLSDEHQVSLALQYFARR